MEFMFRAHPVLGIIEALIFTAAIIACLVVVVNVFGKALERLRVRRKQTKNRIVCSYCKDKIQDLAKVVCSQCGATLHQECYNINDGCATFQCKPARVHRPKIARRIRISRGIWYPCLNIGFGASGTK